VLGDGEHDFRDAVSTSLRREALNQGAIDEPADGWRQDHEPDPEPGNEGIWRAADGAVVGVAGEEEGEPRDEVAEEECSASGSHANDDGEDGQAGWSRPNPVVQSLPE
jgi:hypothetical protein